MEEAIYGCPGTGKTTTLNDRAAFYRDTVAPEDFELLATSFGQTAVQNLQHRIGSHFREVRETVATLHAFGYRQLDSPALIGGTKDKLLEEWNKKYPQYAMTASGDGDTVDDYGRSNNQGTMQGRGDDLMAIVNLLRNRLLPEEQWNRHPQYMQFADFWQKWQTFKEANYAVDFTDMIEIPYRRNMPTPFGAKVALVDEAQDLTPLMLARVRQWEAHGTRLVQAGDDDQSINQFNGADPAAWTEHAGIRARIVLPQSYRMPVAVHDLSQRIISRVSQRVDKQFLPTERPGSIEHSQVSLRQTDALAKLIEESMEQGSVMVLTTCNYMLAGVLKWLRQEGITFWNKNRPKNRIWNPLHFQHGVPTPVKINTVFYQKPWHWEQAGYLADVLQNPRGKGLFTNASKVKELAKENKGREFDGWALVNDAVLQELRADPLDFFKKYARPDKWSSINYGLALADRGPEYIYKQPAISVGTIFSVKGDEADTVIVAPDLSPSGYQEYSNRMTADSAHRLFYVGVTRARERVIMLNRSGQWAYNW